MKKMLSKESLKKINLVVFDLDGTLLNSEGKIGKESIQLVSELKKLNVQFTFASGRLHSACVNYAKELDLNSYLITLDGSLIKNYPSGEIYFESFIREKDLKRALALADKYLLKVALCHADAIYYDEYNSVIPDLLNKFGAKYEEVPNYTPYLNNTLELVLMSDYKENIKEVNHRLKFPYIWGLTTNYYKSQSKSDLYFLDVRKKGSTKGSGLKRLIKKLKIKWSQTAVIGDWYNDQSLFESKAQKIAVANAVAEIKYNADYVTNRTNNEDGVAEYLEMILKAKNSSK